MKRLATLIAVAAFAIGYTVTTASPASATTTQPQSCTKSAVTIVSPLTVTNGKAELSVDAPVGCKVGIASYESTSATFNAQSASKQTLYAHDSVTSSGKLLSLGVKVPSCFFQVDAFVGPLIVHLSESHLYNGSLVTSTSGGTTQCLQTSATTITHQQTSVTTVPASANTSSAPGASRTSISSPSTELASSQLPMTGSKTPQEVSLGVMLVVIGGLIYVGSVKLARRYHFDYRGEDDSIADLP